MAAVALTGGMSAPCLAAGRLQVDGDAIVDRQGREVVLRGANVSGKAKLPPFLPIIEASELDILQEWGFNTIRLVLTWEALEPQRGEYRTRYLDAIEAIVDASWRRGLWVVLDMHQALYSRALGGDGAPTWAIPEDVDWEDFELIGPWPLNHLRWEVNRSFTAFWLDEDGVQSAYLDAWAQVAARLGDHPAVIGYDPINEPWAGFLLSLHFDWRYLQPFYDRFHHEVRVPFDPEAILFPEPNVLTVTGSMRPSFRPFDYDNVVLNLHWYDAITLSFLKPS